MAWNDWNRLRLQQMFGQLNPMQSQNQAPQMPVTGIGSSGDPYEFETLGGAPRPDPLERYQEYKPQMEMQNLFSQQARNAPQRSDFQPNGMRKIGAALAGMGTGSAAAMWGGIPTGFRSNIPAGIEVSRSILDEPYNQAAQDYKMRIDPLRAAADDERMANTVQSQYLDRTVNRDIQNRNLERMFERDATTARQGDVRLEQAQQKIDISNARAAVYKLRGEQREISQDSNGYIIGINKNDPRDVVYAEDEDGNYIKGSRLDDRTKIELGLGAALQRIGAGAAAAQELKGTPAAPPAPVTTESTEEIRDAQGNVVQTRGRSSTRGPSNQGGPEKPINSPAPPPGHVWMRGPDGKTYAVPEAKVQEYTRPPHGMMRVP